MVRIRLWVWECIVSVELLHEFANLRPLLHMLELLSVFSCLQCWGHLLGNKCYWKPWPRYRQACLNQVSLIIQHSFVNPNTKIGWPRSWLSCPAEPISYPGVHPLTYPEGLCAWKYMYPGELFVQVNMGDTNVRSGKFSKAAWFLFSRDNDYWRTTHCSDWVEMVD